MNQIKPLPLPTQPIAAAIPPTQPYGEYLKSMDAALRSVISPVPDTQSPVSLNYTLAAVDSAGIVEMSLSSANTVTVPLNANVPLPIGFRVTVAQLGTGATTITPDVGVTIRNRSGLVLAGQFAVAYLYKRATDVWVASGDLS